MQDAERLKRAIEKEYQELQDMYQVKKEEGVSMKTLNDES